MGFKDYILERFGVYVCGRIVERGGKAFLIPDVEGCAGAPVHREGILVGRLERGGWKPTTRGVQYLFLREKPARNFVVLSRDEFFSLIRRGFVEPERRGLEKLERGYVVLFLRRFPAGVGFFDGEKVLNKIPKKAYRQLL